MQHAWLAGSSPCEQRESIEQTLQYGESKDPGKMTLSRIGLIERGLGVKSVSSMQGHAVQDVSRTEKRGNMLPLAPVPIWTYPSAYTLYGHPSTHLTLSPER